MKRGIVLLLSVLIAIYAVQANAANPFKKLTDKFRRSKVSDFIGDWEGEASIPGSGEFPIYLSLESEEGGSWNYPSTGCAGNMQSIGKESKAFAFKLNVSEGSCKAGSKLLLSPEDQDQLKMEWFDAEGQVGLTAILDKKLSDSSSASVSEETDTTQITENEESGSVLPFVQPNGVMRYAAVITKNANMRESPSTDSPIVVVIPQGSDVAIAPIEGNWYQTYAVVDGESSTGWVYKSLIETSMVDLVAKSAEPAGDSESPRPGELDMVYAGYSEKFLEVRTLYAEGDLTKVSETYDEQEAKVREKAKNAEKLDKNIGLLRWLERGVLDIDEGDLDDALNDFTVAEYLLEQKEGESKVGGFFKKVGSQTAQTLSGYEEIGMYKLAGWEKVLMLNYKTISYLLQGDRRAYNVTRRAIDWQNIEKREFDKDLAEEQAKAEEKFEKEKAKEEKKLARAKARAEKEAEKSGEPLEIPELEESPEDALKDALTRVFTPLDKKAESVSSAYVNPFGFYVAGMVQEFESYSDRSLQDNARISYSKALELNPDSEVLQTAVEDMKNPSGPGNVNLLHVVVADGFVPEKKMLTYFMQTQYYGVVPFKLQMYDSVESEVGRIEVHSMAGKKLATLSTVANIEALCLRQQLDTRRFQVIEALTSTIVSATIEGVGREQGGITGGVIRLAGKLRQDTAAPDMRSWMSLPATLQAARLRMKKGVGQVKIVSFNRAGQKLASQVVNINPDDHGVVYVRSIDNVMFSHSTNNLWM